MKVTDFIENKLDRLPKGYIFTYIDFMDNVNKKEAVIKALNRMASSGKISKLAKGKYFKPETTVFGDLNPDLSQIVKDLLEDNGKVVGYLTGYSIYNKLGLTTQVSNVIQIGRNNVRAQFKRERYTISFIKQNNTITKENIPLLQILDAIRYIKKIPDAALVKSAKRLKAIIQDLSDSDKNSLVKLAQKYPPAARALLGLLLEDTKNINLTALLNKTLNPITTYKFPGLSEAFPYTEKWNIK
ncbi:MAG TPA: DUF6088 family protein [Candidatus Wunengus sp. YC63]|uniref:DUF6088 family protein n=1 Tax=Candidatus Wunengus sp. YC63 TaxID=3367699 RepID=UPI004029EAE0